MNLVNIILIFILLNDSKATAPDCTKNQAITLNGKQFFYEWLKIFRKILNEYC